MGGDLLLRGEPILATRTLDRLLVAGEHVPSGREKGETIARRVHDEHTHGH